MLESRTELLRYFGARSLPALEQQFNSDGRCMPVLLDSTPEELLVATGPFGTYEVCHTIAYPIHVSDLLGQIEIDRLNAEYRALG